jgi:enediyne biosynthesis protein E4
MRGSNLQLRILDCGLRIETKSSDSDWQGDSLVRIFLLVSSLLLAVLVASISEESPKSLGFSFTNVAREAGLNAVTIFGGKESNKYLLETTGCGIAFLDYDNDGWLDILQVNGTTLEGFSKEQEPISHLYRNRHDGTFEDVTLKSGLVQNGWGQGVCVGDFDNDGQEDVFISYWGQNQLFKNKGDGTFENVTQRAGLLSNRRRWGSGCAFLDYDRDGYLDIFVANYIDFDIDSAPVPESGLCLYKGIRVACGPPGLPGGKNVLFHNNGNGKFADVSEVAGITKASGTYGLGVSTLDFNNDGWTDIYVANDSNPSTLYRNNQDGTFSDVAITTGSAYSQDGKPQAGMGVAVGDYDRNGSMDIFKTNFAGDTSTLYSNTGKGFFEDVTFSGGIGLNTRWLGWGCGFVDLDNNGWLDLFLANGHVYPEVYQLKTEAAYKQRKVIYRNLQNGKFEDITDFLGPPATTPKASRGCAFGDFDNDGDIDVVINNVHEAPDLFRLESHNPNHWLGLVLMGTRSNRSAIGSRVRCVAGGVSQLQEVHGGGSYFSQNDLRVHFGLGAATRVDRLEVRWPNGLEEEWNGLGVDRFVALKEGSGNLVRREDKEVVNDHHPTSGAGNSATK